MSNYYKMSNPISGRCLILSVDLFNINKGTKNI